MLKNIMENNMKKIATLVGCAIGDALGNPFENKPTNHKPLLEWDGLFKAGGTYWVGEPGQYTDDTLMSLALARSLVERGKFEPSDVAQNYLNWYLSGNTRGIGGTTARAMNNLKLGLPWHQSGITGDDICGNGTAMRAAPLGVFYRNDLELLNVVAKLDASITHNSLEAKMGSVAIATATALFYKNDTSKEQILDKVIGVLNESIVRNKLQVVKYHLDNKTPPNEAVQNIGVRGYVPETVAAALYCVLANDNYKDTVIMAVKAGGDTDTTAAIAGAMAGTLYGLDAIPTEYTSIVEDFELLSHLDEQLSKV